MEKRPYLSIKSHLREISPKKNFKIVSFAHSQVVPQSFSVELDILHTITAKLQEGPKIAQ